LHGIFFLFVGVGGKNGLESMGRIKSETLLRSSNPYSKRTNQQSNCSFVILATSTIFDSVHCYSKIKNSRFLVNVIKILLRYFLTKSRFDFMDAFKLSVRL